MDSVELEYIKQCLTYDPLKGTLHWRISIPNLGIQIGGIAGNQSDKYTRVKLKGKKYPAHVVGWYLHTGEWCIGQLDHIDRNMQNNKIANLRKVTKSVNQYNRTQKYDSKNPLPGIRYKANNWEVAVGTSYVGRTSSLLDAVALRFRTLKMLGVNYELR